MRRRLAVFVLPVAAGSIAFGELPAARHAPEQPALTQGAEARPVPPLIVPEQRESGPSMALYRSGGNETTLIPPATGDHMTIHPLLIGPPPAVAFAGQARAGMRISSSLFPEEMITTKEVTNRPLKLGAAEGLRLRRVEVTK